MATDFDMRVVLDKRPILKRTVPALSHLDGRNSRMAEAISLQWVSSAKWPVSKKRTCAFGMSRLNASAPAGRKNGSFLPHTAKNRGLCVRKYFWNEGESATVLL